MDLKLIILQAIDDNLFLASKYIFFILSLVYRQNNERIDQIGEEESKKKTSGD